MVEFSKIPNPHKFNETCGWAHIFPPPRERLCSEFSHIIRQKSIHIHVHTRIQRLSWRLVVSQWLSLVLHVGYCTREPQRPRNNPLPMYLLPLFQLGQCNLVWALQGSVDTFRSLKMNHINYVKAFLAGRKTLLSSASACWGAAESIRAKTITMEKSSKRKPLHFRQNSFPASHFHLANCKTPESPQHLESAQHRAPLPLSPAGVLECSQTAWLLLLSFGALT